MSRIEPEIELLYNMYDPEGDRFPGDVQMNYIDYRLLEIIRLQHEQVKDLQSRLARLEVLTGMVAPAPLPVDDTAPAVTFAAGCVDYGDKPETAQVDENGDLRF